MYWPGIAVPFSMRRRVALATARLVVAGTLSVGTLAAVAGAQSSGDSVPAAPLAQHVAIVGPQDLALAGALFLGAAAISPLDRSIAVASQHRGFQNNSVLHNAANAFNTAGGAGLVVVPIAAWAVGRVAHQPRVAATAVSTGEAIVVATAMTEVLKGIIGRARPYAVGDTLPHQFHPGRGLTTEKYASFPSGHSTAAWAAAGILDSELKRYWPHAERIAGPVAYAGAAAVSLSRVYANKHWASDVVAGAAVGSLAARIVAHFNRDYPGNFMDRLFLSGGVMPARQISLSSGVPVVAFAIAW